MPNRKDGTSLSAAPPPPPSPPPPPPPPPLHREICRRSWKSPNDSVFLRALPLSFSSSAFLGDAPSVENLTERSTLLALLPRAEMCRPTFPRTRRDRHRYRSAAFGVFGAD